MENKYTIQDFLEIKSAAGGSFSPNGDIIAFRSNLTGTSQLYLISRNGGDVERITSYTPTDN